MAQIINTNVQSLNAQRNLNNSALSLATSLQRLSSGLRINSAKDDAAGLAISERFGTQIRGLNVAVRNANDGISLSQTAEGALAEISNNLQRIRELAVQARNATNSAGDRAALQAEVAQRLQEIDRTASQTSFNGQKILDGSFGNATFQVGSNAGEVIGLSLETSTRLTQIGNIASATSGQIGANGVGGQYSVAVAEAAFDFSQAASPATNGSITLSPATRNFGTATDSAQVDGVVSFTPANLSFGAAAVAGSSGTLTFNRTDFSAAATAQQDSSTELGGTTGVTDFDYSGAGLAQFDVDGIGVTLTADYGNGAGLAAEIESQLNAAVANGYDVSFANNGTVDAITITKLGDVGNAPVVSNQDVNANGSNFDEVVQDAGNAATAGTNATFTVDGATITLNGNYANAGELAGAIQSQLGVFYDVSFAANGGGEDVTITRADGYPNSADAVVVDNLADAANTLVAGDIETTGVAGSAEAAVSFEVDGNAVTLSTSAYANTAALVADIDAQLGPAYNVAANGGAVEITAVGSTTAPVIGNVQNNANNVEGTFAATQGTAASSVTNASFTLGGVAVTLDQDYADYDALAADIFDQLNPSYDANDAANTTDFTVTNNAGAITITRNDTAGANSASVDVTAADAYASTVGLQNQTGTAGVDETLTGAIEFAVDGNTVSLNGTYADRNALVGAIQTALGSDYEVSISDDTTSIVIENATDGSAAPVVTAGAGQPGTNAAFLLGGTGTAGTVGDTVTLAAGDFTLQGAAGDAVDFAGTYANVDALASEINSKMSGIFAEGNDDGSISIRSALSFTIGGDEAATLGFTAGLQEAEVGASNNLANISVATVEGADDAILRVDAALESISGLRSTFGAIQNRFESTITNLQTTAENLAASRSRILDADFASETANLTRAQILQQAGVAILAQANQLPQNVLSLLR